MQFPSSDCQARHRIESRAIEKMSLSLFGFESFLTHAIFSEHVVSQSAKFLTHNTNNDSVIRWRYKLDAARPGQAGLQSAGAAHQMRSSQEKGQSVSCQTHSSCTSEQTENF